MEKTATRPRRNPVHLTTEADRSAHRGGSVGAAGDASGRPAITAAALQRLEEATLRKVGEGTTLVMPDAILQERNDVLAVINELEDQLDRQQEVREALERELKATHERQQTSQQRVQELEWQHVAFQARLEAMEHLRQEVAELEGQLADASSKSQRTAETLSQIEQERDRLNAELKSSAKQLEELWTVRKERDSLRGECKTATTRIEELERSLRETQDERSALQTRLNETQSLLDEARTEKHEVHLALRAADERIRESQRAQEELGDKLETLRAEKKALHTHAGNLERENARMVEQRQYYERELTSLRNSNRSSEAALTSIKKAFSEVRIALTGASAKVRRRSMDGLPRGLSAGAIEALNGLPSDDSFATTADAGGAPTDSCAHSNGQRVVATASAPIENLTADAVSS